MKITQEHLDSIKPIVEQILSRMYNQKITLTDYSVDKKIKEEDKH